MTRASFLLFAIVVAVQGLAPFAHAANVVETPQTRATIITDRTEVAVGEMLTAGLSLDLKSGWHTYWRNPGDSGLPAEIAWNLPQGMSAGPIQWPSPHRIPTGGLMNFGYDGQVVLPLTIAVGQDVPLGPIILNAHAVWLACADICIPEEGEFTIPLDIVAGPTLPSGSDAIALARALAQVPTVAPWPVKFIYEDARLTLIAGPRIDVASISGAAFYPDGEQPLENAAPQELEFASHQLLLHLQPRAEPADPISGVFVLEDSQAGRVGYEVKAEVVVAATASQGHITVWIALAFAFIGGLILNLMPCVLPVLVMKVLSVMKHHASPPVLRRDALVYTAGVLSAFTILVVALLALRAGGEAVGWGFQMQNPAIVTALAGIMLALGLSLSGVFTIGGGIAGVGQNLATKDGSWGAYFTGVLAVVVATPCTAPFMGVALGFAMTQPPALTIVVFEGLALGLALPYLVIAFVPSVARLIPRPGVWTERLKQILAFALYSASAWLVWVLAQQVDASGLAVAFVSLTCIAFAAWCWGIATENGSAIHRGWMIVSLVALILALAALGSLRGGTTGQVNVTSTGAMAEPYSASRLNQLRTEHRPIFVNFTAAWCITCLVNERFALSDAEVAEALTASNTVYMKADWTNRDPEITAAIHALGRDGVPVYVLYAPNAGPVLLPQILTPGRIIDALNGMKSP